MENRLSQNFKQTKLFIDIILNLSNEVKFIRKYKSKFKDFKK